MDPKGSQILRSKYKTPAISQQKDSEVYDLAKMLCQEIHIITNWNLPATKIEDSFYKALGVVLKMKYEYLNFTELKLAFLMHSSKIINYYNKPITIPIIEEVLMYYLSEREIVIEEEKQYVDRQVTEETKDEISKRIELAKNLTRQSIEQTYQSYLNGTYDPNKSITGNTEFDMIVNDEMADEALKNDFLSKGIIKLKQVLTKRIAAERKLEEDPDKNSIKKELSIKRLQEELNLIEKVEIEAKKIALLFVFGEAKKQGLLSLYKKED